MKRLLLAALALGALAGGGPAAAHPPRGFVFGWDAVQCGGSATDLARLLHDCVWRVMHPRGVAGGESPEVAPALAARVCRSVRTAEMGRSVAGCVRALMYERSGLGSRREEISPDAAALACRYATSVPEAELVESCMRRLLYTRDGLGHARTELSPEAAAVACQGAAATRPPPWVAFAATCRPPGGEESIRFVDACVKGLLYERDGLGARREEITPEAAVIACEGVLSAWP